MTNHFKIYSKKDLLQLTHVRRFETKLGEIVKAHENMKSFEESIKASSCKYVIFGIPEDAGVKANLGIGGAEFNGGRAL